jgi:hypothetical protein
LPKWLAVDVGLFLLALIWINATRADQGAGNNGATVAELEAIFGWKGGKMAALYTQGADRARLARRAIDKLSRGEKANATPHPIKLASPHLK